MERVNPDEYRKISQIIFYCGCNRQVVLKSTTNISNVREEILTKKVSCPDCDPENYEIVENPAFPS